jgi:hypothetical protein
LHAQVGEDGVDEARVAGAFAEAVVLLGGERSVGVSFGLV